MNTRYYCMRALWYRLSRITNRIIKSPTNDGNVVRIIIIHTNASGDMILVEHAQCNYLTYLFDMI